MESRSQPDRRRRKTQALSRWSLSGGRRRGGRRADEHKNVYVDRYHPWEGALVLLVVVMCAVDLLLTLDVVRAGGEEWNPIMRLALNWGVWPFAIAKLLLTGAGVLFLLVRVRFRGIRTVLVVLALLYTMLMGWHVVVRSDLPAPPVASAKAPH